MLPLGTATNWLRAISCIFRVGVGYAAIGHCDSRSSIPPLGNEVGVGYAAIGHCDSPLIIGFIKRAQVGVGYAAIGHCD